MKSPVSVVLTLLASAAMVLLATAPASAHTSLIDVQPGEGDTVREGDTVSLTFSDALLNLGTEMIVTDSSGASVAVDVQRPTPEAVAATLPALATGPVTVAWRVVAQDGHPIEGTLTYVAEGAAPAISNSSPPTESASAGPAPTEASLSPAPAPPGELVSDGLSTAAWLGIGAVILAAAGVGVLAKTRR